MIATRASSVLVLSREIQIINIFLDSSRAPDAVNAMMCKSKVELARSQRSNKLRKCKNALNICQQSRDVEAVIFQPLPLPHRSLALPLTKNEKTTLDNFFKLLWVYTLPSSTLHHFEKTKTFIYCYYFIYVA